ncbi:OsmC family protein [Brevundimonas sp. Root1423]|uniref:OsmC family protein n=1 Tax=Brevundimonas sp. Root1423 TaxID=1736462 RepID=UPI0006FD3DCD|nr:OsmC family protein [Brevundimonas sp. Root1423]KQY90001.1 peroxiredoxin [Brevundimonas sp. Root1423]
MGEYVATVAWSRDGQAFTDNKYSRRHEWRFDGGAVVTASSAPSIVPLPMSDASAVDPEEALVASVSACHMLFFLGYAAKAGFVVDAYRDEAIGLMGRDERGKIALLKVTLRPEIAFSGDVLPDEAALDDLHHRAHEDCFIANSIRGEVTVEPR